MCTQAPAAAFEMDADFHNIPIKGAREGSCWEVRRFRTAPWSTDEDYNRVRYVMLRDNGDLFLVAPGSRHPGELVEALDRETRLVHQVVPVPREEYLREGRFRPLVLGKVHPMIKHLWSRRPVDITALEGLGQTLEDQLASGQLLNHVPEPTPFKEKGAVDKNRSRWRS